MVQIPRPYRVSVAKTISSELRDAHGSLPLLHVMRWLSCFTARVAIFDTLRLLHYNSRKLQRYHEREPLHIPTLVMCSIYKYPQPHMDVPIARKQDDSLWRSPTWAESSDLICTLFDGTHSGPRYAHRLDGTYDCLIRSDGTFPRFTNVNIARP